jgi:molecular chaperone HscA
VEASVSVKPSYGLSDEEIAGMLRDGFDHASGDMEARSLREQQVEAQRVIEATEAALRADAHLLSAAERAEIESAVVSLRQLLETGSSSREVKAGIDALNRATTEFAARRMDQSIRRALAGQKVDEVRV